jgi:hypothetical protein
MHKGDKEKNQKRMNKEKGSLGKEKVKNGS